MIGRHSCLTVLALLGAATQAAAQMVASAPPPVPCAAAPGDSAVRAMLGLLERLAASPPVWDTYAPVREPVILALDTTKYRGRPATPACVLVWRSGAPAQHAELAGHPRLSTPLYGFVSLDPPGPAAQAAAVATMASSRQIPQGDSDRLRAAGVTSAVMFPVPIDLGALGQFGEALRRANVDPSLIQAELTVHEGFHLHVQFPTWLDQSPRPHAWPAWDVQPERRPMREACYAGSPAVAAAFEAEVGALLEAFDALYPGTAAPDTAAARRAARRFVELRRARYALLDTVTVPQGDRQIPCSLAETHLELEEGTAQWIGHATLVHTWIRQMASLRGSYGTAQPDAFYRTGPLQFWILDALLGREETRALTSRLARAASADGGVFAEFVALVR